MRRRTRPQTALKSAAGVWSQNPVEAARALNPYRNPHARAGPSPPLLAIFPDQMAPIAVGRTSDTRQFSKRLRHDSFGRTPGLQASPGKARFPPWTKPLAR
jgi:hypothetical protein